jgi:hypothetical protein
MTTLRLIPELRSGAELRSTMAVRMERTLLRRPISGDEAITMMTPRKVKNLLQVHRNGDCLCHRPAIPKSEGKPYLAIGAKSDGKPYLAIGAKMKRTSFHQRIKGRFCR